MSRRECPACSGFCRSRAGVKAVLSCALQSLTSILGNSDFPVLFVGRPGRRGMKEVRNRPPLGGPWLGRDELVGSGGAKLGSVLRYPLAGAPEGTLV